MLLLWMMDAAMAAEGQFLPYETTWMDRAISAFGLAAMVGLPGDDAAKAEQVRAVMEMVNQLKEEMQGLGEQKNALGARKHDARRKLGTTSSRRQRQPHARRRGRSRSSS